MANTKLPTFDGDLSKFLKNLRDASKEYGLTKDESAALGRERIAQATNNMLGTVALLNGMNAPIALAPIAGAIQGSGLKLAADIVNEGRKTAGYPLVELPEDDPNYRALHKFTRANGLYLDGVERVSKERYDLYNAQKKIRNAQKNPGPAQRALPTSFLDNSFVQNLRRK